MYPLRLKPIYDKTIWGNDKLTRLRGVEETGLGTCWEVSAHPHAKNIILNGEYKGKTLDELLDAYPREMLGDFPKSKMLRLAFLDAKDDLSIQVHPYDEYAHIHENDEGKTESWYILNADPKSTLVAGTVESDASIIRKAVEENKVEDYVRKVEVVEGDFICIGAGMLHALGKGILALEIGQNSNTTYRFYDYNRKDANGNGRELHIEKSFDVADFSMECDLIHSPFHDLSENEEKMLVDREEFCVKMVDVKDSYTLKMDGKHFYTISNVKKKAALTCGEENFDLEYTESIFVPVDCENITIKGNTRLLISWVR